MLPDRTGGDAARSDGFATADHQSMAMWLLAATTGNLVVLGAAVLGSGYTGLHGDWLEGTTQLNNQIFLAEVGLTEVRLRTGTGGVRTLLLQDACAEAGGVDSERSHWCALDQLGADTESMLTAAFVPALVVLLLSALTTVQNWCVARGVQDTVQIEARAQALGITSVIYNMTMLLAWSLFFLMCTAGLCVYAIRAPATLGLGAVRTSKSYQLVRACVLCTSFGTLALVARALKLWDTHTVQLFLRDVRESRSLKLALYVALGAQLFLYVPVCLLQLDYAPVICFLGANYLATRAAQMLWSYVLLTLATLPQDAADLVTVVTWASMDSVDRAARLAFILIFVLKLVTLFGMFLMHTRVRFKLQARRRTRRRARRRTRRRMRSSRTRRRMRSFRTRRRFGGSVLLLPPRVCVARRTARTLTPPRPHATPSHLRQFFEFERLDEESQGPPAISNGSPSYAANLHAPDVGRKKNPERLP